MSDEQPNPYKGAGIWEIVWDKMQKAGVRWETDAAFHIRMNDAPYVDFGTVRSVARMSVKRIRSMVQDASQHLDDIEDAKPLASRLCNEAT